MATFLALLLGRKRDAVEQQLYERCVEVKHKSGKQRRELDVTTCFLPLLRWIVSLWGDCTQIALTLDATTLSSRFAILVVSVVYRGNAIPIAWTVVPATEKRAWRRDWLRMLRMLRPGIPPEWTVIVLTDRGLYARWLFGRIVRVGWHPYHAHQGGQYLSPERVSKVGEGDHAGDDGRAVVVGTGHLFSRPGQVALFVGGMVGRGL